MPVTLKPLFEPVQIANAATTYFTAQAATQIDKMTLVTADNAASHYATVYLVPSGQAAGSAYAILFGNLPGKLLQPYESYDVINAMGHVLNPGDFIAAVADTAAKVNLFCSGRVIS